MQLLTVQHTGASGVLCECRCETIREKSFALRAELQNEMKFAGGARRDRGKEILKDNGG